MLRRGPQLETEETVEEERAADKEARRKTEALSEIEVMSALCPLVPPSAPVSSDFLLVCTTACSPD